MLFEIIDKDWETLQGQFTAIVVAYVLVGLAVALDVRSRVKKENIAYIKAQIKSGVPKSEIKKFCITSGGIRKAGKKLSDYYTSMTFFVMLDIFNFGWYFFELRPLPIFTILSACVWVFTEYRSMKESLDEKVRYSFDENSAEIVKKIKTLSKDVNEISENLRGIKDNIK